MLEIVIDLLRGAAHLFAAGGAIDGVKKPFWNHLANHTRRPTIPPDVLRHEIDP